MASRHRVRISGIVVAAGSGARFGAPKQFATVNGIRLVDRAVATMTGACDEVVVVLPPPATWTGPPVAAAVSGGATRAGSVRAGLVAVDRATEIVVVHDAARPMASPALFDAVIAAVRDGADGVVPGIPVVDTIKRLEGGCVVETLDREPLVAVQTPQAFRADVLRRAHATNADATDDAALVEAAGGTVVVVAGEPRNIKVTAEDDLVIVAALLSAAKTRLA